MTPPEQPSPTPAAPSAAAPEPPAPPAPPPAAPAAAVPAEPPPPPAAAPPPPAAAPQPPAAAPPALPPAATAAPPPAAPPPASPPPPPPPAPAVARGSAFSRLDGAGWRPTGFVAGVLAALVIGSQIVNAAIPVPDQPNNPPGPGPIGPITAPVDVTNDVRIQPVNGFVPTERFEGLPGVRLSRGDVSLDVRVTTFSAGPGELLSAYLREILEPDTTSLSITSQAAVTVGGSWPAVQATYIGIFTGVGSPLEGQLTGIVFTDGRAIILDAWAPEGGLAPALPEISQMIDSLEVAP